MHPPNSTPICIWQSIVDTLGSINKKLLSWGVSVNPIKKENFAIKIFFQLLLNKVLRSCEKVISADVKASRFILLSHKENTKKYHYKVNINI